ncbi:MAG: hypothetical protein U0T84_13215 [Chitinophagales bacterium]
MARTPANYKDEVHRIVQQKKQAIPTAFSAPAVTAILATLEDTVLYLQALARKFDDKSARLPIVAGKRSFRETLIHLLNFEALHYHTAYMALLLREPKVYPIHAERDIARLKLFAGFTVDELVQSFCLERKKYLSFLRALQQPDWARSIEEAGKARHENIYLMARRTAIHDYTHIQILIFQTGFTGTA